MGKKGVQIKAIFAQVANNITQIYQHAFYGCMVKQPMLHGIITLWFFFFILTIVKLYHFPE